MPTVIPSLQHIKFNKHNLSFDKLRFTVSIEKIIMGIIMKIIMKIMAVEQCEIRK